MRLALTYVAWWVALFWLWLLYQGEWNRIEWVAAACAATLGAALATALAARGLLRFRVPLRSVWDAKNVPLQIAIDFGIVSLTLARRLLGRPVRGKFVVRPSASAVDGPSAAGDRAWRTVLATLSPNAYVVDVNADSREVLVHDLVVHRSSESPA
jgi:multisubunit Na+/H+ antiporter MnhE subunit